MISLLYIPGSQAIATLHLLVDPVVCTALTNVTAINAGLLRSVHGMSVAVFNVKTRSPTRSRFSKTTLWLPMVQIHSLIAIDFYTALVHDYAPCSEATVSIALALSQLRAAAAYQ
jgi:hypothetical protein